jgi:hypothetical protein
VANHKQWRTQEFFFGAEVQQIQLRIEGRENGDLGAVAPYSGVPLNLQMNETHILIRLLRMYVPRNREFGSALAKLRNFRGGWGLILPPPQNHLFGTPLVTNTPWPLCLRKRDPVPTVQEPGRAWSSFWKGAGNLVPTGIQSPERPRCS